MIEKLHFSLADWDYSVPGPYISDEVFISPPTSLAAKKTVILDREGWVMCKLATAQNIFDGRIVNYIRLNRTLVVTVTWFYRVQAYPTTPLGSPANCYRLQFVPSNVVLHRRVAGGVTEVGRYTFSPELTINTWYQFRHTWWQYLQPDLTKLLRHRLEWYKDGAWVRIIQADDSANSWADSPTNQIGFGVHHGGQDKPAAIDNTELWKRLT